MYQEKIPPSVYGVNIEQLLLLPVCCLVMVMNISDMLCCYGHSLDKVGKGTTFKKTD